MRFRRRPVSSRTSSSPSVSATAGHGCTTRPRLYSDVWMVLALAADAHGAHRTRVRRCSCRTCAIRSCRRVRSPRSSSWRRAASRSRSAPASPAGWRWGRGRSPWAGVRGVHRAGARAAARRSRRGRRCDGADAARRRRSRRARPIATPIVVAANGPKGLAVARGAGRRRDDDRRRQSRLRVVLRRSRSARCSTTARTPGSARALEAAGPGLTVVFHGMYEGNPEAVDGLPGGAEWRARIEARARSVAASRRARGPPRRGDRARPAAPRRRLAPRVHVDRDARGDARTARRRSRRAASRRSCTRRWDRTSPRELRRVRRGRWAGVSTIDELFASAKSEVESGWLPACQLAVATDGEIVAFETFGAATDRDPIRDLLGDEADRRVRRVDPDRRRAGSTCRGVSSTTSPNSGRTAKTSSPSSR